MFGSDVMQNSLVYVAPVPPMLIDVIQAILIVTIVGVLHYCISVSRKGRGDRHDKA